MLAEVRDDRVPGFMHRHATLLFGVEKSLAHVPEHDLVIGLGEVAGVDTVVGCRLADKAASFTRFARSAPENPGVVAATMSRFTSAASGLLRL